jgi:hypothetical protein
MRAQKCPHCGVWFGEDAFELARREDLFPARPRSAARRQAALIFGSLLLLLCLIIVLVAILK